MQIYEALKKDHETVKNLLDQLLALSPEDQRRATLVERIRDELIPHSRAEESVFYNPLRELAEDRQDILRHSFKEHLEAETLLRTLQLKSKTGGDWIGVAQKLRDALDNHIQEEEGRLFSIAKSVLSEHEATMIADAFERLKPEIREEGILRTTVDMIVNMMPARFTKFVRAHFDKEKRAS